ncbi:L-aspartate oxidase [Arenimonas terrae]|uniref:L-aspartate oxidase n=1 Tax=Arenimonas terrae TaxID=2546226 RepID=UPI001FE88B90|nr:L-aspartate oxidase [Arenimonas terrae]
MPAPLVVVGAGVAGLSVALAAAPRRVLLFSRAAGDGATALAQGGIAAALAPDDDPDQHAADTLAAGAAHNDAALVSRLVNGAPEAIRWLAARGVPFDREGSGWQLGREGGHQRARIVHAGGDASGRELLAALSGAVATAPHIERREGWTLRSLRLQDGRIAGVGLARTTGRGEVQIETPDVVLATGGIGALFAATTNPPGADGAGLAIALAAGAAARDLEFVQFHPTALAVPGLRPLPLVTEALRGAGAVLRDAQGRALMAGVHPLADLAPRDRVARRIWSELRSGGEAWLDATALDASAWRQFPTVRSLCLAHGIDPRVQPIPVTPAAHFHMGGIAVDARGRSRLPGLHAVGEVSCSGVHGANRLASNSLLEGVVFGRRLGEWLRKPGVSPRTNVAAQSVVLAPAAAEPALLQLREWLWQGLGPVRDEATMRHALARIDAHAGLSESWQAGLARQLLLSAIARRESLGAHHRVDVSPDSSIHQRIATPAYGENN